MQPTPSQLKTLQRWRTSTFWVMLIGYIGYYIGRANLPVALPLLSREFGYSNEKLGLMLTFSELAYALGKFTTGPLADKVGGKRIFLVGLCGAIAFNFLFPLFTTLAWFTLIWCLCRYFLSMGWGGVIKTIGEWYEPERNGVIMGLISVNFQFGSVIAAVFCGFLLKLGFGWQGLFVYPAFLMSAIAVWAWLASKDRPSDVVSGVSFGRDAGKKAALADFSRPAGEALSARKLLGVLLGVKMFRQILVFSFLSHVLRSTFLFWIPKFLVDAGMGTVAAAFSSAVFPLLGCVGTILLGWYTDRFAKNGDRARMMWIMLVGLTLSLFVISRIAASPVADPTLLIVFLGFAGFFLYGPFSMSAGCLSLDIAGPEGAGTCTGMIDGVGYIGGALAAWGAGLLSTRLGWSEVFLVLSLCSGAAVGSAYGMSRAFRNDLKQRKLTPAAGEAA